MFGINCTFLGETIVSKKFASGVSVFFSETLSRFDALYDGKIALIVYKKYKEDTKKVFPGHIVISIPRVISFWLRISKSLYDFFLSLYLFMRGVTVYWEPYSSDSNFNGLKIKSFFTIHDIIPFKDCPDDTEKRKKYEMLFSRKGTYIAISDYVLSDITSNFKINGKTVVIPDPVTVRLENQTAIPDLENKKYILDVNAYQKRKNAETLVRAFAEIADKCEYYLVFCGGCKIDDSYEVILKTANELHVSDRVILFYQISDEEKTWLMSHASLFVSPTLSEGFGRTPIEAAMCKTMVLTSRVDSLPEATKDLLHYYDDPKDYRELAEKMYGLLLNPDSEEKLEAIANEYKVLYSADKIASEYLKLFGLLK